VKWCRKMEKHKRVYKMDFVIIGWLAIKLIVDTAAFIWIIWRLTEHRV